METDDVLSDQMQVCRPQFIELLRAVAVRVISDTCDIVCQRVKPYVSHVLRVEVNRDSPFERCSGHAQILQPREQEVVHHLILSGHRLNELRMSVDMLDQTICIFAHLEEIRFLFRRLYLTSAVRTFAVDKL